MVNPAKSADARNISRILFQNLYSASVASEEKNVVVLQSNYLPWKGYFDLISKADLFIFYDDVQFTKNDWRNRNKIKTPRGADWISIPCGANLKRLVNEVTVSNHEWQADHWNRICINYSKTEYFNEYKEFFEDFYLNRVWGNLSELMASLAPSLALARKSSKARHR